MNSENLESEDICRVCRSEGTAENPLFYPCVCMGTIKYVHQDCLVEWLKYSKKETCELCKHSFTFIPIYSADMPKSIPLSVLVSGVGKSLFKILKNWIHYTLVILAWVILVPFAASRMYTAIFHFNPGALLPSSLNNMDGKQLILSYSQGFLIVVCCVSFFMYLVWLKEQILNTEECVEWLNGLQNVTNETPNIPPDSSSNVNTNTPVVSAMHQNTATSDPSTNSNINNVISDFSDGSNLQDPLSTDPTNSLNAHPPIATAPTLQNINDGIPAQISAGRSYQITSIMPHGTTQAGISDVPAPGFVPAGGAVQDPPIPENIAPVPENEPQVAPEEQQAAPAPLLAGLDHWDRAVEDLTWENLLGLDGSYNFLEHALWMIVFNALFIFLFAFLPYHYGKICFKILGCDTAVAGSHFDSFLSTFVGYLLIGQFFLFVRQFLRPSLFTKIRVLLGVSFYIIKVCLLMITEIGIFPFICGWFLDLCSLNLFGATFRDRSESFLSAPIASSLAHWLVGMVYVFYFASAVIVLREVLRPGILWFLRNLNDPDFNPVKEMLLFPALKHLRRFLCSMILFSTIITITVYLPTQIVWHVFPKFLPYNFMSNYDSYFAELPLELLLFHVVVPSVMEQNQARACIKAFIYLWAQYVGRLLGLRSYLLGDEPSTQEPTTPDPNQDLAANPSSPTATDPQAPGPASSSTGGAGLGSALNQVEANSDEPSTSSRWESQGLAPSPGCPTDRLKPSTSQPADFDGKPGAGFPSDEPGAGFPSDEPGAGFPKDEPGASVSSFLECLNLVDRVTPSASASSSDDASEYTLSSPGLSANEEVFGEESPAQALGFQPAQGQPVALALAPTTPLPTTAPNRRSRRYLPNRAARMAPNGPSPAGPTPATSYTRPSNFYLRLSSLALVSTVTSVGLAVTFFTLPVYLGRLFLKYFTFDLTLLTTSDYYYNNNPNNHDPTSMRRLEPSVANQASAADQALGQTGPAVVNPYYHHDLYTALTGTYFIWFAFRSFHHLHNNWARLARQPAPPPPPDPAEIAVEPTGANPSPAPREGSGSNVLGPAPLDGGERATNANHEPRVRLVSWPNIRAAGSVVVTSVIGCLSSTVKCLVAFLLLSGLIPLLMGILFEQAVVFPLRIPMDRTPLVFLAQDWMFGLLLVKLAVALTLMGPEWWLRTVLEQIYHDGIANLRLSFIIEHLVWPCVSVLGLCLSLPYVLTTSVLSCFGVNAMLVRKVQRHIYPSLLTASLILAFLVYQTKQLKRFYQHIKDERYLVGKKLMNYERKQLIRLVSPASSPNLSSQA